MKKAIIFAPITASIALVGCAPNYSDSKTDTVKAPQFADTTVSVPGCSWEAAGLTSISDGKGGIYITAACRPEDSVRTTIHIIHVRADQIHK